MRRALLSVVPAAAFVVVSLAAPAATASPTPSPTKGTPAAVAHGSVPSSSKVPALPTAPLRGYQQVVSDPLTDTAGTQTSGSVSCPTGTKVVGGGAVIASASLDENLNGSLPLSDGRTWRVYVNNASTADGMFLVYATCVTRVASYAVVTGSGAADPVGAQAVATVDCPSGTVPLGGGGFGNSVAVTVNLNSSFPTATGWRADMNNASAEDDTSFAVAVCGVAPNAYNQVVGRVVTVKAGTQGAAAATCPSGRSVLGGGAFSSSASTAVNLNTSEPTSDTSWKAYENNSSSAKTTVKAYAICAKTA